MAHGLAFYSEIPWPLPCQVYRLLAGIHVRWRTPLYNHSRLPQEIRCVNFCIKRPDVAHLSTVHYQGPIVRIAPNHISISDPDALNAVYGHGTGSMKSEFYDAFVAMDRGLFNVRDRNEHTRKRKAISHIFAQKSVVAFEPKIHIYVTQLLDQWDRLCGMAAKGMSGNEGEGGWTGKDGKLYFDALPCRLFSLFFHDPGANA